MSLLRSLYFITAKFNIIVVAVHIAGKSNLLADALSRNNMDVFFAHYPQAHKSPAIIPWALVDLLLH